MSLSLGLAMMSFLKMPGMIAVFIFMVIRYLLEASPKKLRKWIVIAGLFIISSQLGYPKIGSTYHVKDVFQYKIIVKRGFHQYEIRGKLNVDLDDLITIDGELTPDASNIYHAMNNYQGWFDAKDVVSIRSRNTLRRKFWRRFDKDTPLYEFLKRQGDSMLSVLSLQLSGMIAIVMFLTKRFINKSNRKYIEIIMIILYGWLFGASFGVIRLFIRALINDKDKQIVILLLLYPQSVYYSGFTWVYLSHLLKNLSVRFKNINEKLMRVMLLLNAKGRVHLGEVVFYKLIRLCAGLTLILALLGLDRWATSLYLTLSLLFAGNRFSLVGKPMLLWFGLLIIPKKKQQWLVFLLMCLLMTYNPLLRIVTIDVGQGDATLLVFPFNIHAVLIDTGRVTASERVIQQVHNQGLKRIDELVITHMDSDHAANIDLFLEYFDQPKLITEKHQPVSFLKQLLVDHNYEDDNANSLILYGDFGGMRFLFTGDAGIQQERDLIRAYPNLAVDFLKLGHHGSRTSSDERFIQRIKPKYALISSNPSVYGHPHVEVMKRLDEHRIIPFETSKLKTITFFFTPICNWVVTESGGFGIIE